MIAVFHLLQLTEMGAHLLHAPGEALDSIEQGRVVQVPENFLAVVHGVGIVQGAEQHLRDEVMLLAITRDRGYDLVEVQVRREEAIRVLPAGGPSRRRLLEQQAGKMTATF